MGHGHHRSKNEQHDVQAVCKPKLHSHKRESVETAKKEQQKLVSVACVVGAPDNLLGVRILNYAVRTGGELPSC